MQTVLSNLRLLSPLTLLGLLVTPGVALSGPVVRQASGANIAAIQATVDQFRADLGGANNGPDASTFPDGRREINWDGVADALASPNSLAGDTFRARGAVFTTPGSGFQVSMDDDTPADADPDAVRFSQFHAAYGTEFVTFTAQRLFTPTGSTITDVTFRVPGTNRPATVRGFGAVFTDVDVLGSSRLEFFDEYGARINVTLQDRTAPISAGGLSFVGVSFDAGERVARVRVTSGTGVISTGAVEGPGVDAVALDDFLYGEPQAQTRPATLNTAFGLGGVATVDFGGALDRADAVLFQPDGKIVMAGTGDAGGSDFAVVRLNEDGSYDTTFSDDGRVTIAFGAPVSADRAYGIALQSDGRLVVVGGTNPAGGPDEDMGVARLTADGRLDDTFAGDGTVIVDFGLNERAHAVAVQADGRIVVAGWVADDSTSPGEYDFGLARLLPDGSLDPSFHAVPAPTADHGNGRLRLARPGLNDAWAISLQADGTMLVAGRSVETDADMTVVRLRANGTLDPTFGNAGWATVDFGASETAEALVVLPDDRIALAGTRTAGAPFTNLSDAVIARLLPNGALDSAFNAGASPTPSNFNGRLRIDFGGHDYLRSIALQVDGKCSSGAASPFHLVARYLPQLPA